MKRIILSLLAAVLCLCVDAQEHTPENDHVLVTLNDGSVVEGYIQTYWVSGSMFKRMNTEFTMSAKPDGNDPVKYDADKVRSIDFVKKISSSGVYDHLESLPVANPSVLKPKRVRRQFVYKEGETESGTIYWWNGVDSQNMQLGKLNVSTIFGVRLAGDDTVVPFMSGSVISLNALRIRYKKTNPELVDYVDQRILKGGKRLWDNIAANPMLFLEICDEYMSLKANKGN